MASPIRATVRRSKSQRRGERALSEAIERAAYGALCAGGCRTSPGGNATLRLVAGEARIRRHFKPGFALDEEPLGLSTSTTAGSHVVYIHPDRLEQAEPVNKLETAEG